MDYEKMNSEEQISNLIKPILQVLQVAGGTLEKSEIRARICELDDGIAEFEQKLYVSKKTHNEYKKFDYKFNFAIKELAIAGFITYTKRDPTIALTEKGFALELKGFSVKEEVREKARPYWDGCHKNSESNKKKNKPNMDVEDKYDESAEDDLLGGFKIKLQSALANMSPAKFEQFSRQLLTKMGVQFTGEGVKISKDGGIDGLGYHKDDDDFRTTKVVIQCKRFNSNPVGEPAINEFIGAMNKNKADYGVFITNGRFTESARYAARQGSPITTLIDGKELIELIIKYKLHIIPVTTYVLDDFYLTD